MDAIVDYVAMGGYAMYVWPAYAVCAARSPFADIARVRLDEVEALYLEKLMATRDANEGLKAFIEKRQPKWEHR